MSATDSWRRVAAARRADFERAVFEAWLPSGPLPKPFQRAAGQRVRGAGAALVEEQQVARGERRGDRLGDEFAERQRRLAGSAGQREDRVVARRGARQFALDAQARSSPAAPPARLTGTGTEVHENAAPFAHGPKLRGDATEEPGELASASVDSRAAGTRGWRARRRIFSDNSCPGYVTSSAQVSRAAAERPDERSAPSPPLRTSRRGGGSRDPKFDRVARRASPRSSRPARRNSREAEPAAGELGPAGPQAPRAQRQDHHQAFARSPPPARAGDRASEQVRRASGRPRSASAPGARRCRGPGRCRRGARARSGGGRRLAGVALAVQGRNGAGEHLLQGSSPHEVGSEVSTECRCWAPPAGSRRGSGRPLRARPRSVCAGRRRR